MSEFVAAPANPPAVALPHTNPTARMMAIPYRVPSSRSI